MLHIQARARTGPHAHQLPPSAPECVPLLGEGVNLALQARHPAFKLAAGHAWAAEVQCEAALQMRC